tara:strand:- start:26 stop:427 length:402 start_codon:yes stop_codon:yes gene_type:complete
MSFRKAGSDPFRDYTDAEIADIVNSNNALDAEEARIRKEEKEEIKRREDLKKPFRRIKRSPLEIINRLLFLFFIGSFLVSFVSVYASNHLWFIWYLISAFSCILYTPNRKALKELLDAWPNIEDLIKNRSLWK